MTYSCGQLEQDDRPAEGFINICLDATEDKPISNMEETISHELLHKLVVNEGLLLGFYRNAIDGSALTPSKPPTIVIDCVNGKAPMEYYSISSKVARIKSKKVLYEKISPSIIIIMKK